MSLQLLMWCDSLDIFGQPNGQNRVYGFVMTGDGDLIVKEEYRNAASAKNKLMMDDEKVSLYNGYAGDSGYQTCWLKDVAGHPEYGDIIRSHPDFAEVYALPIEEEPSGEIDPGSTNPATGSGGSESDEGGDGGTDVSGKGKTNDGDGESDPPKEPSNTSVTL